MLRHRHIEKIAIGIFLVAVFAVLIFMNAESFGLKRAHAEPGYEVRLFDKERVHAIDIQIDDWDAFLETAPNEEYSRVGLLIDGEKYSNVGLRAKGNNSLRLTEKYGHQRYSLKIEFDHFENSSYYGLDK